MALKVSVLLVSIIAHTHGCVNSSPARSTFLPARGAEPRTASLGNSPSPYLLMPNAPVDGAEACFRRALEVAREQQARWLEPRTAVSLARLWQAHGRRDEARELLAGLYGWSSEGFDTVDLVEAKVLLEELE